MGVYTMKGYLVLEDGTVFEGVSAGVEGERIGDVVLNTAVVGYQEMMTDPANAGKILVPTYPLIGNYGVAEKFSESPRCWIHGLAVKELSSVTSNWQAEDSLRNFIVEREVLALDEIDTRTLAVTIRDKGEMRAIMATGDNDPKTLLKKLKDTQQAPPAFIKEISVTKPTEVVASEERPRIAVIDLGIPRSFIRQLDTLGCTVTLLPYNTKAEKILKSYKPDGLIISSGPENDEALPAVVEQVKKLLGKLPILGISTGHEIIARVLGAVITKMKVGHHGVNYPVKKPDSFKGYITVQNHSYVVDESSLEKNDDVAITLRNVNDDSIEELQSGTLNFISTQYYPASPGNGEVNEVFENFFKRIERTSA